MRDITGPYLWTTHGVNDTFTNTFKSQLRKEMNMFVQPWQLGAERDAYAGFRDLPTS